MKIKPVGNYLLLEDRSDVANQAVGKIIIPDTARSMSIMEIIELGPDAAKDKGTGEPRYGIGELVIFRPDSPALTPIVSNGKKLHLLPATHVIAKAVLEGAEA